MPPTRRQTARSSHPRGRGVLRRLMDPTDQSASIIANTSNSSVNIIPSASSSVSQQALDLSAWTATQVGGQVKLCTIHSVVDLKTENGEEFAFITYTGNKPAYQSIEPEWEPVKNLRNADALIERCRQRQAQESSASKSVKFSTDLTNTREFSKSDTVPTMRTLNPVQLDPKPKPILKAVQKVVTDASDPMQIDEDDALTELKYIAQYIIVERISTNKTNLIFNRQWKGPLTKGKNNKFIANVVIKQVPESYQDEHIFTILKNMNQMCMINVIPSSYALQFVIKDDILQNILSMESEKNPHSYDAFGIEQRLLRVNDLEYEFEKICLLGIVNSENLCNKMGLNPTSERMLLIPYNIPEQKVQKNRMSLPKQLALGIEKMDDIDYFMAEVMIQAEGYGNILPRICANNPKFTIYGNTQHSNHKTIIFCMKALGGKYFPIDSIGDENLNIVLVEVVLLNQLNFMPNLIRLRHMKKCQFFVYGYDIKRLRPIKFETYFIPGGLLAVSTKVITTEPQSVERIFRIAQIVDMLVKHNGGKWTILLNPKMKTHLDKIMDKNYGTFNAKLNSEEIKFFEEDSWKQSQQRHGNNEIDTLYWALLISYRVIAINENPPRHCVLIIHEDEIQLPHSQIPGVEVLTLKEFEKKFDQILQIFE
ncbi:339_t:CDS:10 [Cetraspora pellucida]|uniref:339_t:CDS:1 n=1 Tax=Cetraspora pellucida TaxID=1433469 RepID=A0ACA9NQL4_9GLOM|nr:339_t:CDS:10 [Cetraspora pellucida]